MPHLQTYARLHVASATDIDALAQLEASLHNQAAATEGRPHFDIVHRDSHVILATECQLPVGATEVVHIGRGAIAMLAWLGVARSTRGRGIGHLLVEAAVEHARGEGAAVLHLGSMSISTPALNLLIDCGFVERIYDATHVVIEKALWDERNARRSRAFEPHFYGSVGSNGTAAAAVMIAMASIDPCFMMTPQVERVITSEIEAGASAQGGRLVALAKAISHRSFNVVVASWLPPTLAQERQIGDGQITGSRAIPTPEEMIGLLSLCQIPLLQAQFDRLNPNFADSDWLVVLGFDGLRFQVFSPARPDKRDQAVTLAEMRTALAAKLAKCLVVSRT